MRLPHSQCAPMFKKRERKTQLRKKRKQADVEEDEGEGEQSAQEILEGMRELQRQRAKSHGIDPRKADAKEKELERKRQAKQVEKEQAGKSSGGLLSSLFEQQQERSLVDRQMDDFIERNMAIRRGEDPDAKEEVVKTREDLLYQTPAELAPATSAIRDAELTGVADIQVQQFCRRSSCLAVNTARAHFARCSMSI